VRRRRPSAVRVLPDNSHHFKLLHPASQECLLRRATSSHLGPVRWHLLLRQYLHGLVVYGRVCSEPGPKHIGMLGNNPPQFRFLLDRQPVLHRSLQHLVALDLRLGFALVADFDVVIVIDSTFVRRVLATFRVVDRGSSTSSGSRAGISSSESPSPESASFSPRAQLSPLRNSDPTRLAIRLLTNCSFESNFLVRSCGAITRGQP
jgi:hypothetical protein